MKARTRLFILSLTTPVLLGGCWLVKNSRASVEQAPYQSLLKEGDFELRDYPALTLATTAMSTGSMNGGFGRLFRYITGANDRQEEISMTTPVLIETGADTRTMSFVMPEKTRVQGPPPPSSAEVQLRTVPAQRRAALRFPGGTSRENEAKAAERLQAWIAEKKLRPLGTPTFAYYDPPWTPIPLRRNEVMIHIEAQP